MSDARKQDSSERQASNTDPARAFQERMFLVPNPSKRWLAERLTASLTRRESPGGHETPARESGTHRPTGGVTGLEVARVVGPTTLFGFAALVGGAFWERLEIGEASYAIASAAMCAGVLVGRLVAVGLARRTRRRGARPRRLEAELVYWFSGGLWMPAVALAALEHGPAWLLAGLALAWLTRTLIGQLAGERASDELSRAAKRPTSR